VWIAMCTMPEWTVTKLPTPKGSATTAMSVRNPLSIKKWVPSPPWVSPTTQATTRSPFNRTPDRRTASAALMMLARPPFMFWTP